MWNFVRSIPKGASAPRVHNPTKAAQTANAVCARIAVFLVMTP